MKKMHTRIFLPILVVLLVFPIFTWAAFSVLADGYFKRMASMNVGRMAGEVRQNRLRVKERLPMGEMGKTSYLLISPSLSLEYPTADLTNAGVQALSAACSRMLAAGELPAGETVPVSVDEEGYMIRLLEFSEQDRPTGYLICYSRIPSTFSLLSEAGKLLAGIALFCLLLAALLIWFIARGITRPLEGLCRKTEAIGGGDFAPISEEFSTEELERLKCSINRMAENLKNSEESTLAFFQNASHDLKTPLSSISGYAQGIQCGIVGDSRKAAGIILEESQRMTRLVESILTISKLDSHSLKLHPAPIALDEFCFCMSRRRF